MSSSKSSDPATRSATSIEINDRPLDKVDEADPFCVAFDPDDKRNPKKWSTSRKWYMTMASGLLVLNATFASSAPSGITEQLIEEFHMSAEVATLNIALFVAGYCVGPLLWAPLSEQYGRRPVFIISFFVYFMFQIAMALAKNTASLLVFRFLGGTFAACPLTNSGALISDIWDAGSRGKALAVFTVAPFAGPAIGPTVGGYIVVAGLSWRWLFWILSIFAGICWLMIIFTLPETYQPILLVKLAQKRRKETGDERYFAPFEKNKIPFTQQIEHILARPFKMLFLEPMLMACTVYMSFVYGCLYLLFEAYPIVFTEGHHFNSGVSGLMFIPILCGGVLAVIMYVLIINPRYEKEVERSAPRSVPPEYRLEPVLIAAPIYAACFFWFGWTSFPSISFVAPMLAGLPMGFGICWIFLGLFNYIIDSYLPMAASALAANTVIRSLFGAGFPLFASQMFEKLNPRWASSLLGFIAILMIPIPILFVRHGPTIRRRSKYAPTPSQPPRPTKLESRSHKK